MASDGSQMASDGSQIDLKSVSFVLYSDKECAIRGLPVAAWWWVPRGVPGVVYRGTRGRGILDPSINMVFWKDWIASSVEGRTPLVHV